MKGMGRRLGRTPLFVLLPVLLLVMAFERWPTGGRIKWQSSVDTAAGGFVLGIRDKMGDMPRDYRVSFQVLTPREREYTAHRRVAAGHDEWVEVVFPRDFQAQAGDLVPGVYLCTYMVDNVPTIQERFRYEVSGSRRRILDRRSLFLGPPKKF